MNPQERMDIDALRAENRRLAALLASLCNSVERLEAIALSACEQLGREESPKALAFASLSPSAKEADDPGEWAALMRENLILRAQTDYCAFAFNELERRLLVLSDQLERR